MRKTWILALVSLLTIFALAACGDKEETEKDADKNDDQDSSVEDPEEDGEDGEEEMPQADLDGIPDIVVEVNGEEVTKDEFVSMYQQQFQQMIMQAQMSGQDMSDIDQDQLKKETAEVMVGQNLLTQEANKEITDVSEDDINKTIDEILEQAQMESKDELLAAFEEQGLSEDEFMEQVETQFKVDELVNNLGKDIKVTEDEAKEAYDTLKEQQEQVESDEEFPAFDEIKSDLEEQLLAQKKSEETNALVEKLRDEADVTIHL